MGVFVGLDVSLSKTAVCVVDRDGAVLWQGKVPSEPGPLIARLAEWSGSIDLTGIKACPLSEWLHRGLREAGIPVICIEVRHAQRFLSSRPVKTDRNDARGIAVSQGRTGTFIDHRPSDGLSDILRGGGAHRPPCHVFARLRSSPWRGRGHAYRLIVQVQRKLAGSSLAIASAPVVSDWYYWANGGSDSGLGG